MSTLLGTAGLGWGEALTALTAVARFRNLVTSSWPHSK